MEKAKAGIGGIIILIIAMIAVLLGLDPTELLEDYDEYEQTQGNGGVITEPAPVPDIVAEDWYEIFFTNPTCPPFEERGEGLDVIVADDIRRANRSVDIAAFELNSEPITNALIELEAHNIPVRVVIDADFEDEAAIRRLRRNGISVVPDDRRPLMHNKFIVIDEQIVWTGSMNFTTNGVFCNNNNLVRLELPALAGNYTTEMDEMYNERAFGPTSPENTPQEILDVNGIKVENYFAPEKELAPTIARIVARANQEILFMAFSFTDDDIGEAMIGRAEGGVEIRGVFEQVGSNSSYSYYPLFTSLDMENIQVAIDGNPRIMHHKVIIIDREIVLFGSFNFSEGANRSNDENIVIVHDPEFTSYFVEEFELVWAEAAQ